MDDAENGVEKGACANFRVALKSIGGVGILACHRIRERRTFLSSRTNSNPLGGQECPRSRIRDRIAVRSAFTLIELLVATVLSAVLIMAVLAILSGLSRDRIRLTQAQSRPHAEMLVERLRWDLANARTMSQSPDGQSLLLIGHGGIDPDSFSTTGRLARVVYRCHQQGKLSVLTREQEYLDEPARPRAWRNHSPRRHQPVGHRRIRADRGARPRRSGCD